jgi:hypothetical protein
MSRADISVVPGPKGNQALKNASFDYLLCNTIKDTLKDVFGDRSASTIIRTMENVHSLRLEETPEKGAVFEVALQTILGSGHQIIEDMILENLSVRLGKKHEYEKDYTFADYLNKLRH